MHDYDQLYQAASYFGADADPLLTEWIEHIPRGPVLDLGVGQGRNAWPLLARGVQVVGVDPSAVSIETVSARAAERGLPLETIHGGALDVPVAPVGRFGAVLCFGLLQILPRNEIALLFDRFASWLHPGGLLLLTAWTVDDPSHQRARAWERLEGQGSYRSPSGEIRTFLGRGEGRSLLGAGWKIRHEWEGLGAPHHHGDGAEERHGELRLVVERAGAAVGRGSSQLEAPR
jgi:hypothetical protein